MRGLIAIAPITITIAIIVWLLKFMEFYASIPIKDMIGSENYYPGMGIIVALVFVFFIGAIINSWIIQSVYALGERIVKRIPFVASLYRSANDLMSFFKAGEGKSSEKVVVFEHSGMKLLGLVTRDTFDDLPDELAKNGDVAVYLPLSYQIGGFTLYVPKKSVKPIDMSVEECMRLSVTAGIQAKDGKKPSDPKKIKAKAKSKPKKKA